MEENLSPQQLTKKAEAAYQNEDYEQAIRLYTTAKEAYTQAGDALSAAEMSNNLSVVWLRQGNAAQSLQALDGAEQVFAQAGDTRRQAMTCGNQAAALEALNRRPEAISAYEQSAALFRQAGETDLRVYVLKSLSALQMRAGRRFEAMATMQAALDSQKSLSLRERLLRKLLQIVFSLLRRGPTVP